MKPAFVEDTVETAEITSSAESVAAFVCPALRKSTNEVTELAVVDKAVDAETTMDTSAVN